MHIVIAGNSVFKSCVNPKYVYLLINVSDSSKVSELRCGAVVCPTFGSRLTVQISRLTSSNAVVVSKNRI